MIAKLTLSALALALAAPAFAASTTQLERAASVEAGAYTLNELAQIVSAEERNDAERLKAYLGKGGGDVSRADFSAAPVTRGGFSQGSDR